MQQPTTRRQSEGARSRTHSSWHPGCQRYPAIGATQTPRRKQLVQKRRRRRPRCARTARLAAHGPRRPWRTRRHWPTPQRG
eukprot:2903767-Lingulodinium_polyedra.AAC.1